MPPSDDTSRRKKLLINGRRVRVMDLVEAGLLSPGQELVFERPRIGEVYRAAVTQGGRIKVADGQEYSSPSRAAVEVSGAVAMDGWYTWRVGDNGPLLYQLRQQLLKSLASEVTADGPVDIDVEGISAAIDKALDRLAKLDAARERAEAGKPEELTVRDLLRRWGAQERDRDVVNQIEADLANHGLLTVPDFRAVSLDTVVALTVIPGPDEAAEAETVPEKETHPRLIPPPTMADEEDGEEIGRTLGNLLPDDHRLISVLPSSTLNQAVTQMFMYDFSQVPVLSGERDLRGVVTWRSIAVARQTAPEITLNDAMISARDYPYDTRLLDVLDVLVKEEFVFVRSHDKRVYGIVTAADVVRVYNEMATPFFLIGEVDQELRRLIRNRFDIEEVRQVCAAGADLQSFDDMTMGDYLSVLRNGDHWDKLRWDLDRKIFGEHLDEIRKIRNKVTHFNNPDPISQADVSRLRNFLLVIRTFDT
ncbi:CBS domain-containing protein [Micromonospora tulbaghiae]|uniref:restriction system modified-DNA reader domain-containing protein n=1 Tax=Micromonospora tulbaghiae TaxID=479978 RepID=UPI003440D780